MKKVAHLLRRFEFHVLLFFVALAFFVKPALVPESDTSPQAVMLAFFVPWAVLIGLLYVSARSQGREPEDITTEAAPGEK